jgi:DNA replication and repair protein RecF
MPFASIRTVSFRNLQDREVKTEAPEIFLVGENGQGKTNFLEAVYFCSFASSFRGAKDGELIKNGENNCSAAADLSGSVCDRIVVTVDDGKKSVVLDGKKIGDRTQLIDIVPSVVFCHEDMEFVAGPPERRRWFFDQSLSLYDPLYLEDLQKYRKILKTRNALLKNKNLAMMDVTDPQIAGYGIEVMKKRADAAKAFSEAFGPLYEAVSGISGVSVRYLPSWKGDTLDDIVEDLQSRREVDVSFGTSFSGPHRDRYTFMQGGTEFARRASTGQRRLLALLLRAAQAQRYSAASGRRPVLLLDDVLLELDPEKRRRFLGVLPDYDQAFFTFLPGEPYDRYQKDSTSVYYVEGGRVEQ